MSELTVDGSDVKVVDVENERLRERRLKLIEVHRRGIDICKGVAALASEYGVAASSVRWDWETRGKWLPRLVDVSDVELAKASLIDEFDAVLRECWVGVEVMKSKESWHGYNGAVKNLRETLVARGEFLQSLGVLPKAALEYKVESRKEEVKVGVDRNDSEVLSQAARILDKAEGSAKRSDVLH